MSGGGLESVLINAYIDERQAINIISKSLALRISRDTLHSFMSLPNHLAGVNNTREWEVCYSQVKHHAEKLSLICGKFRHRIQMMCKLYIYVRDGQSKNWMSLKIYHVELTSLRAQMTQQLYGLTQRYNCSHYKSALYGGGRMTCPYKDKPGTDSKQGSNAFILRMVDGDVTTPNL